MINEKGTWLFSANKKSVTFHVYQYCDELTKIKQVTEKEL